MKKIFLLCVLVASGSARAGGAILFGALGTSISKSTNIKEGEELQKNEKQEVFVNRDFMFAGLVVGSAIGAVLSDFVKPYYAVGIGSVLGAICSYKLANDHILRRFPFLGKYSLPGRLSLINDHQKYLAQRAEEIQATKTELVRVLTNNLAIENERNELLSSLSTIQDTERKKAVADKIQVLDGKLKHNHSESLSVFKKIEEIEGKGTLPLCDFEEQRNLNESKPFTQEMIDQYKLESKEIIKNLTEKIIKIKERMNDIWEKAKECDRLYDQSEDLEKKKSLLLEYKKLETEREELINEVSTLSKKIEKIIEENDLLEKQAENAALNEHRKMIKNLSEVILGGCKK